MGEVVPEPMPGPEPGVVPDPVRGVPGEAEPLPEDDAQQVEETASEDEG